ncbi:hypothetical protein [Paremcibacter congregatus]|uniref:hypothetical protein n=1 Tax=Paremcibacter congregatus TaxID=2043170 RepID=UPI0030EEDA3A|tara:strand:+ start:789 stop:1541 length:753 start_codon:yes stop_codon:yes gene_type:complete
MINNSQSKSYGHASDRQPDPEIQGTDQSEKKPDTVRQEKGLVSTKGTVYAPGKLDERPSVEAAANGTFTISVPDHHTMSQDGAVSHRRWYIADASLDSDLGVIVHDGKNLTYNPGSAFDALGEGERDNVAIHYKVCDGQAICETGWLCLTVTGGAGGPLICEEGELPPIEETRIDRTSSGDNPAVTDLADMPAQSAADPACIPTPGYHFLDVNPASGTVSYRQREKQPLPQAAPPPFSAPETDRTAGIIW